MVVPLFRRNGYNTGFIENVIYRFLNKKRDPFPPREGPEKFKVFVRLPFIGEAMNLLSNYQYLLLNLIELC